MKNEPLSVNSIVFIKFAGSSNKIQLGIVLYQYKVLAGMKNMYEVITDAYGTVQLFYRNELKYIGEL